MSEKENRFPPDPEIRYTIDCDDLEYALEGFIGKQGYRLLSIFPADAPRRAIVEREGTFIALERTSGTVSPHDSDWHEGRAGMAYRDLLPDRAGGRLIASHIRISEGGPVPDYVHFHKIDFQVIYCLSGSCKLVYESQGGPFEFSAGDCVLQPPGIRHRVLECSEGFEVLELSSPAEHPTFADHEMDLPNGPADPEMDFGGQRFHRFEANDEESPVSGLGLEEPSSGAVQGKLVTTVGLENLEIKTTDSGSAFVYVVRGSVELIEDADHKKSITQGSSFFIPNGTKVAVECSDSAYLVFTFQI